MTRARSGIPVLPDFNPDSRQRRTHRRLDGVREALAMGILSPIDDAALPHITDLSGALAPAAAQAVAFTGENLLQGYVQSTAITDEDLLNGEVTWSVIAPGSDGDDYTITITDNAGATVIVVSGTDISIACNITGGVYDATTLVADVAADATAREHIVGLVTNGGGGGIITAQAETAFTGGQGGGDFLVEIAGTAQTLLNWSDTAISAELDLSGFSSGDIVEILVVADGIEYRVNVSVLAGGGVPAVARGGVGYFDVTGATDAVGPPPESFTIGTETWTFQAVAAAALGEVQAGAGTVVAAANIVTAINAFSELVTAHIVAGGGAGSTLVALVPRATGVAGNYVLDAAGTANMAGQDMQGGSAAVFEGVYPVTYTVTGADCDLWLNGQYVPVACSPYTDEPLLYGMSIDRAGTLLIQNGFEYRMAQSAITGFYEMEILDGIVHFQAGDRVRFILGQ